MPVEHSAGAIIFRKEEEQILFLLLCYPPAGRRAGKPHSRVSSLRGRDYWDLPKGHIEKGETEIETVEREVGEETGLKDIKLIKGFKEFIKYFFRIENKNIFKTVVFYLAGTKTKKIKISSEHIGFEWLPYEKALEQLTFKNAKNILEKANEFLLKMG